MTSVVDSQRHRLDSILFLDLAMLAFNHGYKNTNRLKPRSTCARLRSDSAIQVRRFHLGFLYCVRSVQINLLFQGLKAVHDPRHEFRYRRVRKNDSPELFP